MTTRNVADDASNSNKATIVDNDRFPMVDSESNPTSLKEVLWSVVKSTLKTYFDTLYSSINSGGFTTGPQSFADNYSISLTVSSNNITVALKDAAGSTPSSGSPVKVRIGNSLRTVTAALSVTKNAGTNWFNSGSAELATNEQDYFVYLGYNATDGVVIGFSRIPFANK